MPKLIYFFYLLKKIKFIVKKKKKKVARCHYALIANIVSGVGGAKSAPRRMPGGCGQRVHEDGRWLSAL